MDDGLLLYRINVTSDDFSIDEELEFSTYVLADSAQADLALRNVAVSSTGCAPDP